MKRPFSVLAAVVVGVTAGVFAAGVNGAIFTTVADGTTVNGNIYAGKSDVYLNGGPQNEHGSMLSPDGLYYFQVTDPSGAVLLSTDPIECRMLRVADGRVSGVPAAACVHATGAFNPANGSTSVQLMPFDDTPNHGGEYKTWITPVAAYGQDCSAKQGSHGFCDADSKTDNFKVRESAPKAAFINVCKFNDFNANGTQDGGEPFIAHWPLTATGVDGGTSTAQTNDDGCVTFAYSGFEGNTSQVVTLSEGSFGPDWAQTAPTSCGDADNCSVDAGVITLTVVPGSVIDAPNFGNTNPFCQEGCDAGEPIATATSFASLTRTFDWAVAKRADRTVITSASAHASASYTVTVEHDNGTDSDWALAGAIRVANPSAQPLTGLALTAAVNGGTCTVTDGEATSVAAGSHNDFSYRCAFLAAPAAGDVTVAGTWDGGSLSATSPFNFSTAAVDAADDRVVITDSMVGELGELTAASPSPAEFTYSAALNGVAGTCTTINNTASLLTNTRARAESASQAVRLCVGADLSMTSTASTSFLSAITKTVDRTVVQQQGGSAAFNYKIAVTESGWVVSGVISVSNPNDWQDVVAQVTLAVPGASCDASASSVLVPASASVAVPYSCAFASAPAASVTASASASWDASAAATPGGSAQSTSTSAFEALTVIDVFNGGAPQPLGVIASPAASTTYSYSKSVTNAAAGACRAVSNTASISGRAQSASVTAFACNTTTGSRTIGFWQNKNGQGIVTGAPAVSGVCSAATWLRRFTPFQDLAANANCKTVASYVTTIIKNASSSGTTMNAMLKAQMLATALDVFFSDAALGGNALAAPVSVGSVRVDITNASAAFGGATSMTVAELLQAQNSVSNAGGTAWYGQSKTVQELAKNVFDAINNENAPIAR